MCINKLTTKTREERDYVKYLLNKTNDTPIYIYIYKERERERERNAEIFLKHFFIDQKSY